MTCICHRPLATVLSRFVPTLPVAEVKENLMFPEIQESFDRGTFIIAKAFQRTNLGQVVSVIRFFTSESIIHWANTSIGPSTLPISQLLEVQVKLSICYGYYTFLSVWFTWVVAWSRTVSFWWIRSLSQCFNVGFLSDPNCWHKKTRARVATDYLNVTEQTCKSMKDMNYPFLVVHSSKDEMTDPAGSQQLFDQSQVV